MLTEFTITTLRTLWPDILPSIVEDLNRVTMALIQAESVDTIRALQGQARALLKTKNLPEALAARVAQLKDDS